MDYLLEAKFWTRLNFFATVSKSDESFFSVPPKSVTLGKPEPVRAGESLQLACTAKDSNPKTTLTWYRDDNPLPDGAGKYFKLQD